VSTTVQDHGHEGKKVYFQPAADPRADADLTSRLAAAEGKEGDARNLVVSADADARHGERPLHVIDLAKQQGHQRSSRSNVQSD